jgi:hypothetical protein
LNVVFDGVAETVDYQLERLLPMMGGRNGYYRLQATLAKENGAFDDTSEANFAALDELGRRVVEENDERLELICAQLGR